MTKHEWQQRGQPSPTSSGRLPPSSVASLGDKLQWLAGEAPNSLRTVEAVIDGLIAVVLQNRQPSDNAD